MLSGKKKEELMFECLSRGVALDPGRKYLTKDYERLLAQFALDHSLVPVSWGRLKRHEFPELMQAFSWKHLKPEEREEILQDNGSWVAQEKFNGVRLFMTFRRGEGFRFFGRHSSLQDFLPIEYTSHIGFFQQDMSAFLGVASSSVFQSLFSFDFAAEVEAINYTPVDTSQYTPQGVLTVTQLTSTVILFSINAEASVKIQREQKARIVLHLHDILYVGNDTLDLDIWKMPFRERIPKRNTLFVALSATLLREHFENAVEVYTEKEQYYQDLLLQRKKGCMYKHLDRPYLPSTSRRRDAWVKRKESFDQYVNADIDAFVIGFLFPAEGKRHAAENQIGGLKLGVYLEDEQGQISEEPYYLAAVLGIPDLWRKKMSQVNESGVVEMNPEYLGTVFTVNGQVVSARNKRLTHARIDWRVGMRFDKSAQDCVVKFEHLEGGVN